MAIEKSVYLFSFIPLSIVLVNFSKLLFHHLIIGSSLSRHSITAVFKKNIHPSLLVPEIILKSFSITQKCLGY